MNTTESKPDSKKYHNYSLSFYQKDQSLIEVSSRAEFGFSSFQRHEKILKPRTIDIFSKFSGANKSNQRSQLEDEGDAVMEALFDVVKVLNSDRELMEFVLPTIDAILIENPRILRELANGIKESKNTSLLSAPKSILAVESHQPASYEAATRIVCILLGELPRETFFNEQKSFLLECLGMRRDSRKQKVSDFCLLSSLIHLNKHESLAEVFIENNGGKLITDSLRQSGSETQMLYYTLLNIWLLSFVPLGVEKLLAVPKYGVLKSVCEILQKLSREKLTRVAFMIFKNVEGNQTCLELLIDGKLLKIIDTLLKGNIKDEALIESIKSTGSNLENNIRILSNFDKYAREINSEHLEWSSVHTERFWKENAMKFEQNEFQLIKYLVIE